MTAKVPRSIDFLIEHSQILEISNSWKRAAISCFSEIALRTTGDWCRADETFATHFCQSARSIQVLKLNANYSTVALLKFSYSSFPDKKDCINMKFRTLHRSCTQNFPWSTNMIEINTYMRPSFPMHLNASKIPTIRPARELIKKREKKNVCRTTYRNVSRL